MAKNNYRIMADGLETGSVGIPNSMDGSTARPGGVRHHRS